MNQAAALRCDFPIYAVTGDVDVLRGMQAAGVAEVVSRSESAASRLTESLLTGLKLRRSDVEEGVAECSERREEVVGGAIAL